jgi:hypothetical protein
MAVPQLATLLEFFGPSVNPGIVVPKLVWQYKIKMSSIYC